MRWIFLFLLCSALVGAVNNSYFIPANLQHAYQNGTRSMDGAPGPNYWQNHSDYTIQVQFQPETRQLSGKEAILYYNESPDSLPRLVFRLYQDLYKKGNLRDWPVDVEDLHDGVQLKQLTINGENIDLNDKSLVKRRGTNLFVELNPPLPPQTSLSIAIKWELRLPHKSNIRMGTYDSTSFHVAYWYPQVAVYDDVQGWDTDNYSGLQEFYNDFCNYDVTIKVPANFVVWATGRLQNPATVLQKKFLKRYEQALQSDEIVHIITQEDLENGNITRQNQWNEWHFKAQNVPDFAFSTSDHYLWDLTSAVVDPQKARRVLIGAAFKVTSKDFFKVAEIARKSILYFSTRIPGIPFPYPSLTVFNGQGGMEFPMMVNDGSAKQWRSTVHVTSHEIAHTYFPFYMGINERKYAWMDEGWATMLPFEFQAKEAPGYDPIERNINRYVQMAGTEFDIPMMVPTSVYGGSARGSYRNASYNRSGTAYYLLKELLGEDLFLNALQTYMERWNGKHPIPFDFFFTFNQVADEDLGWFWKPWFFEFAHPDLQLSATKKDDRSLNVSVINKGGLPLPVKFKLFYQNGLQDSVKYSLRVWKENPKRFEVTLPLKNQNIEKIELGDAKIPDINQDDNVIHFKQ